MAGEDTISVKCACGKKLKAPASAAGRKARCPACGSTVVLTVAEPAQVGGALVAGALVAGAQVAGSGISAPPALPRTSRSPRVPVSAPDEDGLGALHELAEQAESAPAPVEAVRCPQCRSALDDDAVVCFQCGYDSRTGKALSTSKDNALPPPVGKRIPGFAAKKPVDRMAPQGSFVLGLALSAAFAAAASVVWIVVAYVTGMTLGYIGLLIGGAAGFGMHAGQKGYSNNGGVAAAAMTLVAIVLAKVVVIELYLSKHGSTASIFDLDSAKLGLYFFSPIGLIIIVIAMAAAFRTASGSVSG